MEKITRVSAFKTAGILTIIGAVLFIAIIGVFILLAAMIVVLIAFSQMPDYVGPVMDVHHEYSGEIFAENL